MKENRVELNLHTNKSVMKGINPLRDILLKAESLNMKSIAITDTTGLHHLKEIEALKYFNKLNIKVIHGLDLIIDDNSVTVLAKNELGLKNIYKIINHSSDSNITLTTELFHKFSEGLLIGSSHLNGELYKSMLKNKSDEELGKIIENYDYIELTSDDSGENNISLIQEINKKIINLSKKSNKLVVVTGDVCYINKEDKYYKDIVEKSNNIINQSGTSYSKHLKTSEELIEEFNYLSHELACEIIINNTNTLADMCDEIKYSKEENLFPFIPDSAQKLTRLTYIRAKETYGKNIPENVKMRLKTELNAIISNGYESIFIGLLELSKKCIEKRIFTEISGNFLLYSQVAFLLGLTTKSPLYDRDSIYMFDNINNISIYQDQVSIVINEDDADIVIKLLGEIFSECDIYNSYYSYITKNNILSTFISEAKKINSYISENNLKIVNDALNDVCVKERYSIDYNRLIFVKKDTDITSILPVKINQTTKDLLLPSNTDFKFVVVPL